MYSTSCTGQREHGRSHRRIAGIGWLHERWTSLFKWTGVPILSAHTYRWLETSITKGEHNENALLEETGGAWSAGRWRARRIRKTEPAKKRLARLPEDPAHRPCTPRQ